MALFAGIYEMSEASRYLYVTTPHARRPPRYSALRRWVRSGLPAPETSCLPTKDLILTFEDLVSLRMIVAFRIVGFSLQHIRKEHSWLQDNIGYPRPFALKGLWVTETEIFIQMESKFVSTTRGGQYTMEFIKDWLRRLRRPLNGYFDLQFKKVNGKDVASAWTAYSHILLNPLVQFGAPCIEGTRIPTRAVWSMFIGGDKPEAIARDYEVPIFKVQSALEWERMIAEVRP